MAPQIVKPFYNQNGYTEFNNYVLDYIMPKLSPNAWKVLCFIIRKTKGWQKEQDQLSFSQIIQGTGIGGRSTISNGISELEKGNYIIVQHANDKKTSNTYRLNVDLEIDTLPSPEIGLPQKASPETGLDSSQEIGLPSQSSLVPKLDTQKKVLNKPIKQRGSKNPPALQIFIGITGYDKITTYWRRKMVGIVGEDRERLELWAAVIKAWTGKGWREGDIKTQLEYFERGEIPGNSRNGANNGQYRTPNKRGAGKHKVSDPDAIRADIERAKADQR